MRDDAIGNPVEQDKNGLNYSNSFNNLNQNVSTIPGGSLAVMGSVNYAGGTVAVNSVQAQLSPDLIFAATGIPFTLGTNALNTVFTDPFGRSTNRETSVVVTQKAYQYDANGNLTNDGRMVYYWNDENRLVAVRDAKTGALIQENRYDGLGRRRERIQSSVAGGDDPGSTNRYFYQGWLVLAVTDGAGYMLETYTHGADLSGRVGGGAGGIGGILASTQAGGAAYYHYDFNGNVVNVSSSNQIQLAQYTYSPFGEVLLHEGPVNSRYQFSTKEYEASTGMNYYGYRHYSPSLQRWINRDPIGEQGGLNLHVYVSNDPVLGVDPIGLEECVVDYIFIYLQTKDLRYEIISAIGIIVSPPKSIPGLICTAAGCAIPDPTSNYDFSQLIYEEVNTKECDPCEIVVESLHGIEVDWKFVGPFYLEIWITIDGVNVYGPDPDNPCCE